jgi:hypothetical protein
MKKQLNIDSPPEGDELDEAADVASDSSSPDLERPRAVRYQAPTQRRQRVSKGGVFRTILARSGATGMLPGAVSGAVLIFVMSLCNFRRESAIDDIFVCIVATIPAALVGSLVGMVLGLAAGIVVGVETCGHFLPPYDPARYRKIVRIQCVYVTLTLVMAVMHGTLFDHHDRDSLLLCLALYACTFLSALWAGGRIADWYEGYATRDLRGGLALVRRITTKHGER